MKANKELLREWEYYTDFGTITDIHLKTGLSRHTIYKILKGDNARVCNFAKVYKYFKNLKVKISKYND
jgi:predicted transcriptional regulator